MDDVSRAYAAAPPFTRFMVRGRPYICPFEPIFSRVPKGASVLDVGCGVGALLIGMALEGRVARGIGCDVSAGAVETAKTAAEEAGLSNLSFMTIRDVADAPQGPFDVVTVVDVMHHVPPAAQRAFFSGCARRVRPGGMLIYKDMAEKPLWNNLFNRLHDAVVARQWINYVPLAMVREWAAADGLEVAGEEYFRRLAYRHELLALQKA
jgi:2-polyprenyl-3-methyl-5-hydroxy-6-metoxy-1,4-benzoquinol methylase